MNIKNECDEYIIYCNVGNKCKCFYYNMNEKIYKIKLMDKMPFIKNRYQMLKTKYKLTSSDEDMIKYNEIFLKSVDELKNNDILNIRYLKYENNYEAVISTFKRLTYSNWDKDNLYNHENIDMKEFGYMEKCARGALMKCIAGDYKDVYAYDFKNNYGEILGSSKFKIPTKKGIEIKINEVPTLENIKFGFYHIKITSYNDHVLKIFRFSKYDMYSYYSLIFVLTYKKYFNFKLELFNEDEYNAYVYNEEDLIPCGKIFEKWLLTMKTLRDKFKDNILLKPLISTCMNSITKYNTVYLSDRNRDNNKINMDDYEFHTEEYFSNGECRDVLIHKKSPFKFNIRLKTLLLDFGRCKIAEIILKCGVKNCIRVHTDGIILTKKIDDKILQKLNNFNFVNEYSGHIVLKSISSPVVKIDENNNEIINNEINIENDHDEDE